MQHIKLLFPFLMGFFIYALIEIAARGYTHWTMAVTGGAVVTMLYVLYRSAPPLHPLLLCLIGAAVITATELFVGMIVNVHLHWNVWDYSSLPLHFRGQICLRYGFFWFLLCIPAFAFCRLAETRLTDPA
ncbi:MAG: hypothetical protein IJN11_03420 [Oscillospiraceae bacterium]|nr:hypothetical protein [Ruminococcus sp.]MBQ7003076.1 hypothetical protein [Oscillospiraceae bacterium]MBQ7012949.1 hypothetical protein [Oscillospiraceae bacterium]